MTLATPEQSVTDCIEPVRAGFLTLHRVSDAGKPCGVVYVNRAQIIYIQRDTWAITTTWVYLTGDMRVRVSEGPELILTALEDAR